MSDVKGVRDVNAKLARMVGKITTTTTQSALQKALMIGSQYATMLTPVDTSNLINSRFISVSPSASGFLGRVGYTAEYAPYVHDGGPKNWQKPGAEDQFLKKGFERDGRAEIDAALRGEYERSQ